MADKTIREAGNKNDSGEATNQNQDRLEKIKLAIQIESTSTI